MRFLPGRGLDQGEGLSESSLCLLRWNETSQGLLAFCHERRDLHPCQVSKFLF